MITLSVEEYCNNCPNFEANTLKDVYYANDSRCYVKSTITCENAVKCKLIYDYIKKYAKKKQI